MRLAQKARQNLAYDRMPLAILPLPSRWGVQEFQETRVWLERVAEALKEFYDDWVPSTIGAREVVERIKVPQADFFGFGEKLAVVEQGTTDPQGMGFIYERVAAFIAADFGNLTALLGERLESSNGRSTEKAEVQSTKPLEETGYLYDVFVSHDSSLSEWVLELIEGLKVELSLIRNNEPRFFLDIAEIRVGQSWSEQSQQALLRSKVLIAGLTPQYVTSQTSMRELTTFTMRAVATGKAIVLPILIRGSDSLVQVLPEVAKFDFRLFPIQKSPDKRALSVLQREIMRIADYLNNMIDEAPPYDATWTTASDTDANEVRRRTEQNSKSDWRKQILWVDDRPDNNIYERRTIESLGVTFSLALSTEEALEILSSNQFGVIISDMGRREGPREGYRLLDDLRQGGNNTPFIIYAGSNAPKHKQEAAAHGAQGSTNDPKELLQMVKGHLL